MNQNEYKIRNLESQILYLQEEHSNTLKLLHAEIKDLQMKNSETAFQLAMLNISNTESDTAVIPPQNDDILILDQVSRLKSEVDELNSQLQSKMAQIETFEEKIHRLTETISKLKISHKKEVESLEIEMTAKSGEITHLTSKLLNSKRLDQIKNESHDPVDGIPITTSPPSLVLQPPITPKSFKFRNQVSIHPENIHSRHRPIIARQALVATSLPIKNKCASPSFPEYAISIEDRSVFSKSIRRPSILPPINSIKNRAFSDSRHHGFVISTQDFGTDPCDTEEITKYSNNLPPDNENPKNTIVSRPSPDSKVIHVEMDRLLNLNNSSVTSQSKPILHSVTKNSTS